jgi:hypothetical protein
MSLRMKFIKQKEKKMYKKSIVFIFFFIVLATTLFSQIQVPELGDVNNEGSTTIIDALLTAQHYTGLSPSPFYTTAADVDCNARVDIVDALLIAQYYVGLKNSFDDCTGEYIVAGYGEVTYIDVEGGCISIRTDGDSYEPLGLPDGITIGSKIIFRARIRPDLATICMVGRLVEIIQADEVL